jgi:transcriptional regulator GlxA family with amidase domain
MRVVPLAALAALAPPSVARAQAPTRPPAGGPGDEMPADMNARIAARFGPLRVPVKTVGILLYDGYTTLDAMGPYQVLSELPGVEVKLVAPTRALVHNMAGMGVTPTHTLAEVDRLDVLVVPGGFAGTWRAAHDTAIVNWVRRVHPTTRYTTSVCTGAWILGAAGLLRGQDATTHWYGRPILEQEYGAHYRPARYVRAGKIWTSAGVTAGMDMSLALVREIAGDAYTKAVMLDLEYAPEPPLRGGTEATTDPATVAWVRGMYDRGLAPERARTDSAAARPAGRPR